MGKEKTVGKPLKSRRWQYYLLLVVIAICLGIIATVVPSLLKEGDVTSDETPVEPETSLEDELPEPTVQSPPVLYVIIDDIGNNLNHIEPFLSFQDKLTFAVMPGRPHTLNAAELAEREKIEVIMHQPMEAVGGENPGSKAIYTGMGDEEIAALLADNLAGIPGAVGINNHMGSKATSDTATMKAVFHFMSGRGLYYLDSVTTDESIAAEEAEAAGVPFVSRNTYFLDNESDRESINRMLDDGLETARRDGYAILIGHVWNDQTAAVLIDRYQSIIDDGFSFGYLSEEYERRASG
jgi:polysaccharide deacetylase 2 family uncharacterized protein YibQ